MLSLDLTPFEPGLHELTLTPSPEELDLDPEAFADIVVDVRLDYQEDHALVLLTVQATATLECDRTLEMFRQQISGRHDVLFLVPHEMERSRVPEDEASEGDDDVYELPEPGVPLDLTAPVRDTILLSLPIRRVAPGAEDREIPLVFGALTRDDGEPLDARWEALRRLKDNQ